MNSTEKFGPEGDLLSDLGKIILGKFSPGGMPELNDAKLTGNSNTRSTIMHEQTHAALFKNTILGHVISRLLRLGKDKQLAVETRLMLRQASNILMGKVFFTAEGQAVRMQYYLESLDGSIDEAKFLARFPDSYRAAFRIYSSSPPQVAAASMKDLSNISEIEEGFVLPSWYSAIAETMFDQNVIPIIVKDQPIEVLVNEIQSIVVDDALEQTVHNFQNISLHNYTSAQSEIQGRINNLTQMGLFSNPHLPEYESHFRQSRHLTELFKSAYFLEFKKQINYQEFNLEKRVDWLNSFEQKLPDLNPSIESREIRFTGISELPFQSNLRPSEKIDQSGLVSQLEFQESFASDKETNNSIFFHIFTEQETYTPVIYYRQLPSRQQPKYIYMQSNKSYLMNLNKTNPNVKIFWLFYCRSIEQEVMFPDISIGEGRKVFVFSKWYSPKLLKELEEGFGPYETYFHTQAEINQEFVAFSFKSFSLILFTPHDTDLFKTSTTTQSKQAVEDSDEAAFSFFYCEWSRDPNL